MTVLYLREKSDVQSLSFLILEKKAQYFSKIKKKGMKYGTSGVECLFFPFCLMRDYEKYATCS